jgi:hypothetical protein
LAYHRYPHLIQHFCNSGRFGPPRGVNRASAWTWVAHLVSCVIDATADQSRLRPIQTRFRCGSGCPCLSPPHRLTRWLILQKARHQEREFPLTACKHTVSESVSLPSPGFFSPFPHGTCALSVVKRIEPWRVDPPSSGGVSVSRRTRCQSGAVGFVYGAFTLSGGSFQTPRLPAATFTLAGCSAFARHYSRNILCSSGY